MMLTSERERIIKFAPALARALAVASPMPIEAPVYRCSSRGQYKNLFMIVGSPLTTRAVCPLRVILTDVVILRQAFVPENKGRKSVDML